MWLSEITLPKRMRLKSASLYAVKGGADGGTQKWFTSIGAKSSMRPFGAPVVTDRYVMILTNSAPSTDGMHFRIL